MENIRLIDRPYVDVLIKKRRRDMHKGDCGRVLVIAGSHGMAGAAVLCAKGTLRGGAGLVRVSVPEELFPILQTAVPEATCISRDLTADDLKEYQAVVIGPGLGSDGKSRELIETVLKSTCPAIVMDADALNTVVKECLFDELMTAKGRLIITPHPGEAARLLACTRDTISKDRPAAALRLAAKTGAVAVLKGQGTVVAGPDGELRINTTGNPGMATGGSGDVLCRDHRRSCGAGTFLFRGGGGRCLCAWAGRRSGCGYRRRIWPDIRRSS